MKSLDLLRELRTSTHRHSVRRYYRTTRMKYLLLTVRVVALPR